MAGGGEQRTPLTQTLVPSTPAKCIGVSLVLWLHQTIAAVYDVHVKRAKFTTHVQASALTDPFDRSRRHVMAGVHVL